MSKENRSEKITKKAQDKIEVLFTPADKNEKTAVFELWDSISSNNAVKSFAMGERIDVTGRADLVQMIRRGPYQYQFFVNGEAVPTAMNVNPDNGVVTFAFGSENDIPYTEHLEELYSKINDYGYRR